MVDVAPNTLNPLHGIHLVCIQWEDLTEKAQQELLMIYEIESPAEKSWDEEPIATLELKEED